MKRFLVLSLVFMLFFCGVSYIYYRGAVKSTEVMICKNELKSLSPVAGFLRDRVNLANQDLNWLHGSLEDLLQSDPQALANENGIFWHDTKRFISFRKDIVGFRLFWKNDKEVSCLVKNGNGGVDLKMVEVTDSDWVLCHAATCRSGSYYVESFVDNPLYSNIVITMLYSFKEKNSGEICTIALDFDGDSLIRIIEAMSGHISTFSHLQFVKGGGVYSFSDQIDNNLRSDDLIIKRNSKAFKSNPHGWIHYDSGIVVFRAVDPFIRDEWFLDYEKNGVIQPAFKVRLGILTATSFISTDYFSKINQRNRVMFYALVTLSIIISLSISGFLNKLKLRHEESSHSANHDLLTGLPNRKYLFESIDRLLEEGFSRGRGNACMFIDLNDFKIINDDYGHNAGDSVLKIVSGRLKQALRDSDVVARVGGDEFVVILSGTSRTMALKVAERLFANVKKDIVTDEQIFNVTASIGLTMYIGGEKVDDWLHRADTLMYESKKDGGKIVLG